MKKNSINEMLLTLDDRIQSVDPQEGVTKNMLLALAAEANPSFYDVYLADRAWKLFAETLKKGGDRHIYVTEGRMRRPDRRVGKPAEWETMAKSRLDLGGYAPCSVRLREEIEQQDYLYKRGDQVEGTLWSDNTRDLAMQLAEIVRGHDLETVLVQFLRSVATDQRGARHEADRHYLETQDAKHVRDRTFDMWAQNHEMYESLRLLQNGSGDTASAPPYNGAAPHVRRPFSS